MTERRRWDVVLIVASAACTVTALAALTVSALGQDAGPCAEIAARSGAVTVATGDSPGADTVTLAPDEVHVAAGCYWNSAAHSSNSGDFGVTAARARVIVNVNVGGGPEGAERITVAPPEGLMVLPRDAQDVPDGEGVVFYIAEIKV